MKYIIEYYSIGYGASMFATPDYTHEEYLDTNTYVESINSKKLKDYIESKKDRYGNYFKKCKKKTMGFDYISNQGGVKVKEYKAPKFKSILDK
jgi:hypothetical protein